MAGTDKRKQSLYFPEDMLREIQEEANRQDRSLSWIVQQAWKIARNEIMRFPSVNDVIGGEGRGGTGTLKGGSSHVRQRRTQAEPLLSRGDALRDPDAGAAARPLTVLGGPASLEDLEAGSAEDPLAQRHVGRRPERAAEVGTGRQRKLIGRRCWAERSPGGTVAPAHAGSSATRRSVSYTWRKCDSEAVLSSPRKESISFFAALPGEPRFRTSKMRRGSKRLAEKNGFFFFFCDGPLLSDAGRLADEP